MKKTSSLFRNPSEEILFTNTELFRMLGPFILSFALSLLVGMLDTLMVSSVGDAAVSGVSLVDNVMQLAVFVFSAFGTGGSVIAGQYLGDRQDKKAGECTEQLLRLSAAVSVGIAFLILLSRKVIIGGFFGSVTADVSREAYIYLLITVFSLPGMAVYESACAAIRVLGDSRSLLQISLVMNAVNLAGNALLIYGFHMGTAGAAWPTLFSRLLAAFLAVIYLRNPGHRIRLSGKRPAGFQSSLILRILKTGIPNGIENGVFQLGKLIVLRIITLSGTAAIAANAVAIILTNIISLPGWGANNVALAVITRCIGKKDTEQAIYYKRFLTVLTYGMFACWTAAIWLAAPSLLQLFGNLSPEARSIAFTMVTIHAIGTILTWVPSFLWPAVLRASGDVNFVMAVSIFSMFLCRVGGAWLLAVKGNLGAAGVWIAMDLDWICRAVCFGLRWKSGKWKSKRVI